MKFESPLRTRRMLIVAACAVAAATTLPACAPLLLGGAMVGSTLLYTDRRTSGSQLEDESIELKAAKRLGDLLGDRGRVSATSYNRVLLLTGEVPAEADKAAAEQTVQQIENVRTIVNEIAVAEGSSFSNRTADAVLSGKIKASLLDAKDLMTNTIKVVTERRTVYLMGIVTEREAVRAADIASRVSGVHRVVRVFELVSEAELANLVPRQPPK